MELADRIWPTVTDADTKLMKQWIKLYDASAYLSSDSFKGTHHDLKQVFNLLDVDGSQTLSISELVRARILTKGEAHHLLKSWNKKFDESDVGSDSHNGKKHLNLSLGFSDFCLLMQKPLTEKYAQKEEAPDAVNSWDSLCRSSFLASKKKVTLKSIGTTIKTVHAFNSGLAARRNALKYSSGAKFQASQ